MGEQSLRRSTRVLLKVPIEVTGTGTDGQPFQEKTTTVMVDGNGAQIVLKSLPQTGERVIITNLRSRKTSPFLVIRKVAKSISAEPEWAIECVEPGGRFWGIHFPTPDGASTPKSSSSSAAEPPAPAAPEAAPKPAKEPETIEALLACVQCNTRELTRLTIEQYRMLGRQPSLERPCAKCGANTGWKYSYLNSGDEITVVSRARPAPPESKSGAEKRKSKRLKVNLPVRIRWDDGREEVANTKDLSRTGVCFASATSMSVGDVIHVVVGFGGSGSQTEIRGRVVRKSHLPGTDQTLYGVHMEEPA